MQHLQNPVRLLFVRPTLDSLLPALKSTDMKGGYRKWRNQSYICATTAMIDSDQIALSQGQPHKTG